MSTNVTKALRFAQFGPPSVLRIQEVSIPEAGQGGNAGSRQGCSDQPSDIGRVAGRFKKTILPQTPGGSTILRMDSQMADQAIQGR
jgi:hypothetical protein